MRVSGGTASGTAAFMVVAPLLSGPATRALDNGLGQRSPMGWNSWNHFGCNINESLVLEIGDFLVSSGMLTAGYNHVNLDDVCSSPASASASASDSVSYRPLSLPPTAVLDG